MSGSRKSVLTQGRMLKAAVVLMVILFFCGLSISPSNNAKAQFPADDDHRVEVPTGTIIAFLGKDIPEGWLLCNGKMIPRGRQYDKLKSICGDFLPDLRGMFLRGANLKRDDEYCDEDRLRRPGTNQMDSFKQHDHGLGRIKLFTPGSGDKKIRAGTEIKTFSASPEGGFETRPKNFSVNWLIKI